MAVFDRLRSAWNAFRNKNEEQEFAYGSTHGSSYTRPDRPRLMRFNERSIIESVYTRISIDVSTIELRHILVDEHERYKEVINSKLNRCMNFEPNLDQGPAQFRRDIVLTLFDKGCCAVVPVDTSVNPSDQSKFDIYTLRVGEITQWFPRHVRIKLYNEDKGEKQEIILEKQNVAIVENPLYAVMNEPNSTMQRLIRKLSLLDNVDETSTGKIDMIIQLPYSVKSESRRAQAESRRDDIEWQLRDSQYGIAWTDATEKVTQLNRPVENTLLKQVEYLTEMLYSQLGITETVMNGTADESAMINYKNRTIEPVLEAIKEALERSFLRLSGYEANERIRYFQNPFRLVPAEKLAEIADKFARNEILTANEFRGFMGIVPSTDPKADRLENSNMPQSSPPENEATLVPNSEPNPT